MRSEQIFPCLLILLDVCAATVYATMGDPKRAVYWMAAATLTACVTF